MVPVVDTLNEAETLDRVAMQAARTIGPLVDSNAIIGVAWGSTLSAVSRHLTRKITHDSVIVQLNGAGNMQTTGITYASDIMRRFGSAYGARVEQFPGAGVLRPRARPKRPCGMSAVFSASWSCRPG